MEEGPDGPSLRFPPPPGPSSNLAPLDYSLCALAYSRTKEPVHGLDLYYLSEIRKREYKGREDITYLA